MNVFQSKCMRLGSGKRGYGPLETLAHSYYQETVKRNSQLLMAFALKTK